MRALLAILGCFLAASPACALNLGMQITNISDITVPSWSITDSAINQSMDICVYGVQIPALTSYAITATSSPSGFLISNGAGLTIPYSLFWEDSGSGNLGSSGGSQMSDGVKLTNRQNNSIVLGCLVVGPNARLYFKIAYADMLAARAGTYTGTITLLLSPN